MHTQKQLELYKSLHGDEYQQAEKSTPKWFKFKFLGFGSGRSPIYGSNSAYMMLPGGGMLLMECGETVYQILNENKDFASAKWLTIIMSHTHDDHCGSLGMVVTEAYLRTGMPVNIIYCGLPQRRLMCQLLNVFGVPRDYYRLLSARRVNNDRFTQITTFGTAAMHVSMVRTQHVPEIPCYSITINYFTRNLDGHPIIYWSGDTHEPMNAALTIAMLKDVQVYHEVSSAHGEHHTCIDDLDEAYRQVADDEGDLADYRRRTTIMHINGLEVARMARKMGYQLPDILLAELDDQE